MRGQTARKAGFALVFVLAMLVLALAVVLAYFSMTTLDSKIASASTSGTKVRLISQAAEGYILDDFRQEIEAGSEAVTDPSLSVQVQRPIVLTNVGIGVTNTWAPSVVPQRVGGAGITNIVKVSRSGVAFFTNGAGYDSSGLARASAIATTNASANGKFLNKERWNLPKLMGQTEHASFVAPDWIYMDRQGGTPTDFTDLAAMASTQSTNHVIGRYAYVVYDVGGLIDINVVGNKLSSIDNSRRGRLNQVSLTNGIPGITDFHEFLKWRSPVWSSSNSTEPGKNGLFDPKRTFIDVPLDERENVPPDEREQAFVNRQDLLAYVASTNTISTNALPFLTTFSRDLNAPSYEPNSARPKLPASPDPDLMNPSLLTTRFATDTPLNRPGSASVTVKSGTPVMPRRFPLSKLSLFEEANPDAEAMRYYFGLEKVDAQTWKYTAATPDGYIATLSEVAALLVKREPNFFEVLQSVIYAGSLGKFAANTYTEDADIQPVRPDGTFAPGPDRSPQRQVFQIGANIIDQWDENDLPTCLEFPVGNPSSGVSVFGIENLPYLSQIGIAGWRPIDDKKKFQVWAIFDVWNPHQNAQTPPSGIDRFRILPVSGSKRVSVYYSNWSSNSTFNNPGPLQTLRNKLPSSGGTLVQNAAKALTSLNGNRTFTFSSSDDYSTPTTLGISPAGSTCIEPTLSTDTPGLLLYDETLNPAIPQPSDRTPELQETLNSVMDRMAPYTASNPFDSTASPGKRVYPPGTTFVPAALNPTCWTQTVDAATGEIKVFANYGVKAPNTFRLLRGDSTPYAFDLQAQLTNGSWITYQRFEGLFQQLDIAACPLGFFGESGDSITDMLRNTDSSMADALQVNEFYKWRSRGASIGMIKIDPRTMRFGLSGWSQFSAPSAFSLLNSPQNDNLGHSIRSSTNVFKPRPLLDWLGTSFCVPNGNYSSGFSGGLQGGFQVVSGESKPPLFGLVSNNPDVLVPDAANPSRYPDPDGVIRPGDGYFGAMPTALGRIADRPILLNRPFRSVGELGYVFRDVPWKSLDFSTRRSGDLGLLDVFSISETDGDPPLTAGQINLNTRQTAVLATVLQHSSKQLEGINPGVAASELSAAEAQALAEVIVSESTLRPFTDKGDLVARVLNAGTGTDPLAGDAPKAAREAAVRTLAEIGTIRTWNFLIDLVAQTGRFTTASRSGSDFVVQGEERVWIHVAIDRMTGEVLEIKREVVNE